MNQFDSPTPDFSTFDDACIASEAQRTKVLTIVGSLVVAWANNESLLVYFIRYLIDTDQNTASVIFSTLGNARARVDLVDRLTTINVLDQALANSIRKVLREFRKCTTVRNEFNHCIYGLSSDGEISHTQGTRLVERNGTLSLGEHLPFDDTRIEEIAATARMLKSVNRDMWLLIPRLLDMRRGSTTSA